MEFYYVKVDKRVAAVLGLTGYRSELNDGSVLLSQKDVMCCDGRTLPEKVKNIGGEFITEENALKLISDCKIKQEGVDL